MFIARSEYGRFRSAILLVILCADRRKIAVSSMYIIERWQKQAELRNSTFSPEGRLFQVEYSLEAIKLGSTAIGVHFSHHNLIQGLGLRISGFD